MIYKKIASIFLFTLLFSNTSLAQFNSDSLNDNSNSPIEISAGKDLEWQQQNKQYIARGDVVIIQGDVTVKADTVIADYREGNESKTEIWKLTAIDNVTISDNENTIIGDNAVYLIDGGIATITGKNLKLTSPEQIITATEKMEYSSLKGTASAIGNAKVVKNDDTLTSSRLNMFFQKGDNGKNSLQKIEALGNVKIVTPKETLTGNKGTYNANKDTATIIGNVKIIRDINVLEGVRAEVNLTTKISKIFGDEKTGGRVKGIFFPGSSPKTQPINKE